MRRPLKGDMKGCIFALALFTALAVAQEEPETTVDACLQPKVVGRCRASMPRFHFNATSQQCQHFIYGGCGANENNFPTEEACKARCLAASNVTTTEQPLVRCPRLECMAPCEYGLRSDERGCPVCECAPHPCEVKECGENEKCALNDYKEAVCVTIIRTVEQGGADESGESEEEAPTPPCPLIMCEMYCQYEFVKDPETGCARCECNRSPCTEESCAVGEICKPERMQGEWTAKCLSNLTQSIKQVEPMPPTAAPVECPIFRCSRSCDFGFLTDENGCGTCECKMHPCDGAQCGEGQMCKPLELQCYDLPCPMVPNCVLQPLCLRQREELLGSIASTGQGHGLLGEDSWSRPPQQRPSGGLLGGDSWSRPPSDDAPVPEPEQPAHAPSGGLLGGDSWSRPPTGDAPPPAPEPEQPAEESQPMLGADSWSRPPLPWAPECTANGDFKPRQCDKAKSNCWCVDDRGLEIIGSRRNVTAGVIPPVCAFNQTTALHGKFQMSHDIDDIDNHLDQIQELTHQSLSEWLLIERDYITIMEIRPNGADIHILEVDFYVRADQLGYHDLATSSYHLQDQAHQGQLQMDYGDHTLKPKPDSLHIDHEFSPVLPSTGMRPDPRIEGCYFYENHKTAIIAGLLGLAFFLLVLIVLLKMVIAKRRLSRSLQVTQPGEKYRENLAFSNQLYGKINEEEKVVLPNVEFTASSEAVA